VPLSHLSEEQQSSLVTHRPVRETQQTMLEKPSLSEQTTLPRSPVVTSQQSPFWKHGWRSALQAQTPPLQTPLPHSAAKVHRSPLTLLSHVPPGHNPEQQLLTPSKGQVLPAT
jgi:hypothetical protein